VWRSHCVRSSNYVAIVARNPQHRSYVADRYLGRDSECDGLLRRLYITLWPQEGKRTRVLRPVGWICSRCKATRIDRDAFDGLELVPTGGGAVALQLRENRSEDLTRANVDAAATAADSA
jgi:hypothetical protein